MYRKECNKNISPTANTLDKLTNKFFRKALSYRKKLLPLHPLSTFLGEGKKKSSLTQFHKDYAVQAVGTAIYRVLTGKEKRRQKCMGAINRAHTRTTTRVKEIKVKTN